MDWIQIPLFQGISEKEATKMAACLGMKKVTYPKGSVIFHMGDAATHIGVVLSGKVQVAKEDFWGNRALLAQLGEGELFAEAFACAPTKTMPVTVTALQESHILFLRADGFFIPCEQGCAFHQRLVRNLLGIVAAKNVRLTEKIDHLSRRSIREKLLSYLSEVSAGRESFDIPLDRQALADYLAVERSALSREMGHLREEGLLSFSRNHFVLYRKE